MKKQSKEAQRLADAERLPDEKGYSDEFYTPARITSPLGPFMIDPSAGPRRLAAVNFDFSKGENGLVLSWREAVARHAGKPFAKIDKALLPAWVNPPYSLKKEFLELLARYGHGFALVPSDTGARWWQRAANQCSAFLLVLGRIDFEGPDGKPIKGNTKPSTIFAYGPEAVARLQKAVDSGALKGFLHIN